MKTNEPFPVISGWARPDRTFPAPFFRKGQHLTEDLVTWRRCLHSCWKALLYSQKKITRHVFRCCKTAGNLCSTTGIYPAVFHGPQVDKRLVLEKAITSVKNGRPLQQGRVLSLSAAPGKRGGSRQFFFTDTCPNLTSPLEALSRSIAF